MGSVFDRFRQLPLWHQWLWVSVAGGSTVWLMLSAVEAGRGYAELIAAPAVWVGQWVLLRRRVRGAAWWVFASAAFGLVGAGVGGYYGGALQDALDGVSSSPLGIADVGPGRTSLAYVTGQGLAGALLGVTVGFVQWLVLRGSLRRPGRWITANTVAYLVGSLSDALIPVVGVITGLALRELWKPSQPEALVTTALRPQVTVGWAFYLQWVWFAALGFGVGSAVGNAIAHPIPETLQSVRNIVGWFAGGACVGAAQWVLLRWAVAPARWWVVASAMGWTAGFLLFEQGSAVLNGLLAGVLALAGVVDAKTLGNFPFELFDNPFGGAVTGASIGLLQWLVLHREVNGAGWWVLVSSMGWAMAYIAPQMGPTSAGSATALGMITGSLSGVLLVWLLRRRRRSVQE